MDDRALTLKDIQKIELDILCKVVKCLEFNNLKYILCGGTLLGAIRHNGFIPWDDDIDILIPRDDFEKLKEIVKHNNGVVNGIHFGLPGNEDCFYPFIKAENREYACQDKRFIPGHPIYIWIDIFPLDHFPDDEKSHKKVVNKLLFLKKTLYSGILTKDYWKEEYKNKKIKLLKSRCGLIMYTFMGGYTGISRRIDKYASSIDKKYRDSNHVGNGAWPEGMKDYFLASDTNPTVLHSFEDKEFLIPVNYDSYLKTFYGDYMTPPPENKRFGHHITVYKVEEKQI